MNLKLKAFTIMELLIAMVILSLVMGFSITLYQHNFKNYLTLKKTNLKIGAVTGLCKLISDDFFYCSKAVLTGNSIDFQMNDKNIASYHLGDSTIIRTQASVTDTFKVGTLNYSALFTTKPVASGLIDELTLSLKLTGEQDTFRFQKNYGADMLIMADSTNILKNM